MKGRDITDLRFADDTDGLAGGEDDRIKEPSEVSG